MPPERLSKYDAIFYFTDNRRVAMQASVGMLVDGPIDFGRYFDRVSPRIERMPKLRMALKPTLLNFRLPAWVPAPQFNLSSHVIEHTLPSPGSDDQLSALFKELMHKRLPLDEPLWCLHIINGLENNRAALLLRTHHCIADAEGILEMFNVFLEASPAAVATAPRISKAGLAREVHAARPIHGLRALLSRDGRKRLATLAQYARTRGPRFPFTRPTTGQMDIAWQQLPISTLQTIGAALDATASDVVLAALGTAMDAYAARHQVAVAGKHLLLQVPANVRMPDLYGKLGNELAMLPGVVPLGMTDPVERLRRVAEFNRTLKALNMAPLIHGLMGTAFGAATPPGQALMCRTMASQPYLNVARVVGLPPQEHALMSSVVMPPKNFVIDGHPITAFINLIACQFNMGFACSPVAHNGKITLTMSVDANNLGDAAPLLNDVAAAIEQLRGLVQNNDVATPK